MNKDFLEYLEGAIAIEKQSYTQQQTIDALECEINSLGQEATIYREVSEKSKFKDVVPGAAGGGMILGAIVGAIIGLISTKGHLISKLLGLIGGAFKYGLIGIPIGAVVGVVLWIIFRYSEKKDDDIYSDEYHQAIKNDNTRVKQELAQAESLKELQQKLILQHKNTVAFLRNYYNAGDIYPDYQTLNACCSFYEYFASGICTELGGPNGAYNTYRDDVRWGRLLDKMDQVIANLEQIKASQHTLYTAVCEGNQLTQNLLNESVRQTQLQSFSAESNAVTAYISKCNLEEQRWGNFLKVYDLYTTGR